MVNHCPPMIGPFDSYFWVSGTIDVPSGSHGKSRSCSARSSDRLKIQELRQLKCHLDQSLIIRMERPCSSMAPILPEFDICIQNDKERV